MCPLITAFDGQTHAFPAPFIIVKSTSSSSIAQQLHTYFKLQPLATSLQHLHYPISKTSIMADEETKEPEVAAAPAEEVKDDDAAPEEENTAHFEPVVSL